MAPNGVDGVSSGIVLDGTKESFAASDGTKESSHGHYGDERGVEDGTRISGGQLGVSDCVSDCSAPS